MHSLLPVLLLSSLPGVWAGAVQVNDAQHNTDTITKDVVIIGGSSSGTYAAIRLQHLGYSVAVVEKEPILGGQVNTYLDPTTNETVDYGVEVFSNITIVLNYFSYLDVALAPLTGVSSSSVYANFGTDGKVVQVQSSIPWTNASAEAAALRSYGNLLVDYPYLGNGFNLSNPVPDDLLITYGDFLEKYNLNALAYFAFNFVQGGANILAQTTLYVMKFFGQLEVDSFLGNGVKSLTTQGHNNQELYDKALIKLGSNAFVSSNVTAIEREANNVQISVTTPSGTKLIEAKKLLVAIQPTLKNLEGLGLDLDTEEQTLFGQFNNSYYWNMIIQNPGIPDNVTVNNVDLAAPVGIPPLPGVYRFSPSGLPGLHFAQYGSPYYISDEEVQADTLATLAKVVSANGYSANNNPVIVGFANHSPYTLTVSTEAIQNGFYSTLNGIQGQKNTWWTGASWQAQNSAQIWNWTEYTLLPKIVASL